MGTGLNPPSSPMAHIAAALLPPALIQAMHPAALHTPLPLLVLLTRRIDRPLSRNLGCRCVGMSSGSMGYPPDLRTASWKAGHWRAFVYIGQTCFYTGQNNTKRTEQSNQFVPDTGPKELVRKQCSAPCPANGISVVKLVTQDVFQGICTLSAEVSLLLEA